MSNKEKNQKEDEDIPNCKVVLIGETAVGKTCLITRYIRQEFNENFAATIGSTFFAKNEIYKHLKQTLKLQIWDTAGQEKFRSINRLFYSDANAILLVYDITRKETFEELKNYWIKQVEEYAPENSLKVIVGNKSDLYEFEEVSEEDRKMFIEQNNLLFFKTSAKTANGVNILFHQVGKKILSDSNEEEDSIDNLTNSVTASKSEMKSSSMYKSKLSIKTYKHSESKCC